MTETQARAGTPAAGRRVLSVLLVDGAEAPRRALAGQLASSLTDAEAEARVDDMDSVEAALVNGVDGGVPAWDVALVSVTDADEGHGVVTRLRATVPGLPVLLMMPQGSRMRVWPPGVASTDRPARLAAMVSALRAVLAVNPAGPDRDQGQTGRFLLGPYLCDPGGRTLVERASGRVVALTEKEAAILACLRAADGPVARDVLLARVWGYGDGVSTHTLETHIHRLRRKIEPDPRQPSLLRTDDGGYSLGG
ncbi:winged helix-turn-helix domain-containing protein [uncultured Rhodospira sp.]|uniref:winged helix-turn-helix domain-containing protein n=1 Tax=uncultured Rhodospira sp. TaxID=1936189 RepID=UPI00260441D1|nr:winged helix-turn-helix domain-containing protein [uncultured Rhodospira sp.]